MLRLIFLFNLFFTLNFYSQTGSYLSQKKSPGTIEDIVKLLNLKSVKKISISGENNFSAEIILNKKGECIRKSFSHLGNVVYHTYNDSDKLDEKDNYEVLMNYISNTSSLSKLPLYKGESKNYKYNSDGYLTNYLEKGFYLVSQKSREEEEFKENELEYILEYNEQNQITTFYKRLKRKNSTCEITTKFKYINANKIRLKSNYKDCKCGIPLPCPEKLIYRIEYY